MSIFLPQDKDQADKELDCFDYCIAEANLHFNNKEFKKAAIYLENASRSANELERMKNTKAMHDEAWLLLRQIEGKQQQRELLSRLKS